MTVHQDTQAPDSPEASSKATVMARLRAETAEHHARAERQPFQKRLVRGEVSKSHYAVWLQQLLAIHEVLEHALEGSVHDPRFSAVSASQFKTGLLLRDLQALGSQRDLDRQLDATRALVAEIERTRDEHPVGLLGYHYVLEGSTNGNKFIADALARIWGERAGLEYLDPYGERQREAWLAFRSAVDVTELTEQEQSTIVASAGAMFDGIAEISRAMPNSG